MHLESGDDVVIMEGDAVEISDKTTFTKLDALCRKKYKMPLMVVSESVLYCVRPRVVLAWSERNMPATATRWQFERK